MENTVKPIKMQLKYLNFNCINVSLESLEGRFWPLGVMFDTHIQRPRTKKTKRTSGPALLAPLPHTQHREHCFYLVP